MSSESRVRSLEPSAERGARNPQRATRNPERVARNTQPATPYAQPDVSFTPAAYARVASSDDGTEGLRSEINGLRAMIESMKNSGYEVALPPKKREVLKYLRERSIREEYAFRLCDKTADLSEIPLLLSSDIRVKRGEATKKAVMLIGPTGVGKTTTIAKLAARAVKAGEKAALVNLDTYRIGAVEQLRIYARVLGVPLATAANAAELKAALAKFSVDRDVIFIDTTGRNPRDEAAMAELTELCAAVDVPAEIHLLMSAGSDDASMIEAYRAYRALPIDYLGFSKIDEAVQYGTLYNLMVTYQKPVAWITTGQRVPGDIEQATVKRLAGLIMAE
jgi:flagellar biosynthesis protein FlhF